MILTIDIGNTSVTTGIFVNGAIENVFFMSTDTTRSAEDYALEMKSHLEGRTVTATVVSSVVPELNRQIAAAIKILTGDEPIKITHSVKTDIDFCRYDYQKLGMDRIVDMVAARHMAEGAVMVVDMGTCTTISILDEENIFRGGVILPGVQTSLDAMHHFTAKLPKLPACEVDKLIGNDTDGCMESGAIIGTAAAIEGFASRIEEELGQSVTVIATGGMAKLVMPWCRRKLLFEPDLILKGLYCIYAENK